MSTAGLGYQTAELLTPDPNFERVGRIVGVTGGHAIILLDNNPEILANGKVKSPEIGTLLKAETPNSIALALVSAMSAPAPSQGESDEELRIVEVEFIGELPKDALGRPRHFRRGISAYPSLGVPPLNRWLRLAPTAAAILLAAFVPVFASTARAETPSSELLEQLKIEFANYEVGSFGARTIKAIVAASCTPIRRAA